MMRYRQNTTTNANVDTQQEQTTMTSTSMTTTTKAKIKGREEMPSTSSSTSSTSSSTSSSLLFSSLLSLSSRSFFSDSNSSSSSSGTSSSGTRQQQQQRRRQKKCLFFVFVFVIAFNTILLLLFQTTANSTFHSSQNTTTPTTVSSVCPTLPDRLLNSYQNYGKKITTETTVLLTTEEVIRQQGIMEQVKHGTMGDVILKCPSSISSSSSLSSSNNNNCRGIVKIYQSSSIYQHAKYCLLTLQHTNIVPQLLYWNDTTHTIVEEEKGQYTMRQYYSNSKKKKKKKKISSSSSSSTIPLDFDQQLRRIFCILQQHSIVHRDITDTNFVIDNDTGMISIIDFGDAAVTTNSDHHHHRYYYNWRNLHNVLMIQWNQYKEEERMEEFITLIQSQLQKGIRKQWQPPRATQLLLLQLQLSQQSK